MLRHRSLVTGLIAISIIVCGLLGWLAYSKITSWGSYKDDPIQSALNGTEIFLQAVKAHPNGPMPHNNDALPSYLWVNEDCWNFVQEAMRQNDYHYTLKVTGYDDSRKDPYPVHDLTEVFIEVTFPNNRRAEMLFAQGGLAGCRELKE